MKIGSLKNFFLLALFTLSMSLLMTSFGAKDASAQAASGSSVSGDVNNNVLVNVMCNVQRVVTGNAGKAFAAFAIISIGVGFFTGKVSWGLMIGVAAGIAAMFGAATIVSAITGKTTFDCTQG
jgi:type IV secretory pathway VirB2 component (pilin)